MNIYIDESIHDKYGFMLLAYVLCNRDPQSDLDDIVSKYGLDEFHACEKMHDNKAMKRLRNDMKAYVNSNCSWGVLVLPNISRSNLKDDFILLIEGLANNSCEIPISVFVDEGIINNAEANSMKSIEGVNEIEICNSHTVNGIQLADMVAALCGVRLREEISESPKLLIYGEESGFNPPIEAELGYELWASLRYSMHKQPEPLGDDMPEMATFKTDGYGLFVSPKCSSYLKEQAEKLFGSVYLGCIH